MSFNKPEARGTMNPAKLTYRWSGGEKEITLPDGTTAKQAKAELRYYDGESQQTVELPFKFCVIGTTTAIRGYHPNGGQPINYYSNETVDFQQQMKLMRKDANGTQVVAEGTYSQIKAKGLPQGARYTQFVYFYNPQSKQLERFEFSGAAVSEFIQFGQSHKVYDAPISISEGELKKTPVATFIAPKFEQGESYGEAQRELLKKVCDEFDAFALKLTGGDMQTEGDYQENQEPVLYDGEQSQEPVEETKKEEATPDFNDVPF